MNKLHIAILTAAIVGTGIYTLNNRNGIEELTVLPESIAEMPINIESAETAMIPVDPKILDCMQRNIYFEAGDQDMAGKEAVAQVVFKRIAVTNTKTFPKDVCGVVYQRKQFSWTWLRSHTPTLHNSLERTAWEESQEAALKALRGQVELTTGDATHYYSKKAMKNPPYWVTANNRFQYITTIGDHVFYRDTKLKFSDTININNLTLNLGA